MIKYGNHFSGGNSNRGLKQWQIKCFDGDDECNNLRNYTLRRDFHFR